MKKFYILIITGITIIINCAQAQTNVSGGIYSNTSWTQANSPYIVTDTVVVFPGVTLTIQPGVTVKFNNGMRIELRQSGLIAIGTLTDSISFTSNSPSPTVGIWNSIYLNGENMSSKFNYCTFQYANYGINLSPTLYSSISDSLIIKNCNFNFNNWGVYFIGYEGMTWSYTGIAFIDSCNFKNNLNYGMILTELVSATINNCYFSNNGTGLQSGGNHSQINNCIFNSNQTGLIPTYTAANNCSFKYNQTGIKSSSENRIKNCTIDSNSVLGISANGDSVVNCYIRYNGEGIQTAVSVILGNIIEHNTGDNIQDESFNLNGFAIISGNTIRYGSIGIVDNLGAFTITKNIIENNTLGITLNNKNSTITCNRICNNTTYDIKYTSNGNINATHNFWCTPDSASTRAVIYDGYDNINYGLINFMPIDSTCSPATAVNEIISNDLINIYPNPTKGVFNVQMSKFENAQMEIYNVLGERINRQIIKSQNQQIDLSATPDGVYFMKIKNEQGVATKKIILSH